MKKENLKIVFMGTPEFAATILQSLIDNKFSVVGVITSPDRPKGRGKKMTMSEVKEAALKNNLPVFQPEKIKKQTSIDQLKLWKPDLIVVAAYGQIISKNILDLPKYGCINVHASLLPKYRGASPIHYALLNGEKETGITIMKMDEGMDTGEIISNFQFLISNDDNLISLYSRLANLGAKLLVKTIPDYIAGKIKLKKQDNNQATYTKIINKKDGLIDWQESAEQIINKIRAFNPWPGTYSFWNKKKLGIQSAQITNQQLLPGMVVIEGKTIFIGTSDKAIAVTQIQLEGKKSMMASDFILGNKSIDQSQLS